MKRIMAIVLTFAVTTALSAFTLLNGAYASPPGPAPQPQAAHGALGWLIRLLPTRYTVQAGDTLSGVAARYCGGNANDWTGIFTANRAVIGADPNRIQPGEQLTVTHCTDPAGLLHLGSTWQGVQHAQNAPWHPARHDSGRQWGVTYGYPNKCGDGDGDGWDVACGHTTSQTFTQTDSHTSGHAANDAVSAPAAPAVSNAGHYSYSGLEALWEAAGGPSWAAAAAASIAECESGGNPHAYNPSGATGLWQILGQVRGGDLTDPYVNAANAVAKFRASGGNFSAWVCQA